MHDKSAVHIVSVGSGRGPTDACPIAVLMTLHAIAIAAGAAVLTFQ